MSAKYLLIALTCGNPDYNQDPERSMWGVPILLQEVAAEDVTKTIRDWIGEHDIGGGNLKAAHLMLPRENSSAKIYADVNYGGRVWTPLKGRNPDNAHKQKEMQIVDGAWQVPVDG